MAAMREPNAGCPTNPNSWLSFRQCCTAACLCLAASDFVSGDFIRLRTFPAGFCGAKKVLRKNFAAKINSGSVSLLSRSHNRGREAKSCVAIMHQPPKVSDIAKRFAALSNRQQQVASLVIKGLSNKAVAAELDITEGTVKSHLHSIYDKLGIQSRISLMIVLATLMSEIGI
jgi:DNA-binding NarL/FixJ family response regulator